MRSRRAGLTLFRRLFLILVVLAFPALAAAQASSVHCADIHDIAECLGSCTTTDVLNNSCDCYWDAPADIDISGFSLPGAPNAIEFPSGFPQDSTIACPPDVQCCWNAPCSRWFDETDCLFGSGGLTPNPFQPDGAHCDWDPQTGCGCRADLGTAIHVSSGPGPISAPFDCHCPPLLTRDEWLAMGKSCGPPPLDHFTLYKAKTTKRADKFVRFGPVLLSDAFQSNAPFQVTKPKSLGVPSDLNGAGVIDGETYREEYLVKPVKGSPAFAGLSDVHVVNPCNDLVLEIQKPVSLLVPTATSTTAPDTTYPTAPIPDATRNVEHLLCYKAKPQAKLADGTKLPKFPKGIQVDVADQLQTRRYDLVKITKLCDPVDPAQGTPTLLSGPAKGEAKPLYHERTGVRSPRRNLDEHLVCYKARLATRLIAQTGCGPTNPGDKGTKIEPEQAKHVPVEGLYVANQFGERVLNQFVGERLDTVKEAELCIPSRIVAP